MTNSPLAGGPRGDAAPGGAEGGAPGGAEIADPAQVAEGGPARVDDATPQRSEPGVEGKRRNRRRRLLRVTAAAVAVVCLATLAVAWVGVRGVRASSHLRSAGVLFRQIQGEVQRGDIPAARATLASLQKETGAARAETDDLGWRLGSHVPWVGSDLAAVRTVAVAIDDVARRGLPPLVETAGAIDLGSLAPKNGRVDLTALRDAAPRIAAAAAALRQARDRVAAIRTDGLLAQTSAGVKELRAGLQRAVAVADTAERASGLLPAMLGVSGPRTYLVLFQNLAEVRATGGMPGAYLVLTANQGALQLVDQGSAASGLKTFDSPVLPLDPAMGALYTERLGTFPANVNLTPHFPTTAALAREMYRRRSGRTVDGVLATDPVALSYLLAATGPIRMPAGAALTSDNAVRMLLSDVYAKVAPAAQDQYFATAALAAFQVLMGQTRDMAGLVAQLARAEGERRILMWSADPQEERLIAGTMLEGALPITDRTSPTVGVFLNDGTGAKLSYYLTHAAELSAVDCRPDGSMELKLRITLGSTAPSSGLPKDVTGLALAGAPYTVRTNVSIFSPTGGGVMDARLDGDHAPLLTGAERRRSVAIVTVDLKPGATRTIDVSLLTGIPPAGAGPTLRPRLWTTPGVTPWKVNVRSAPFCHARR